MQAAIYFSAQGASKHSLTFLARTHSIASAQQHPSGV